MLRPRILSMFGIFGKCKANYLIRLHIYLLMHTKQNDDVAWAAIVNQDIEQTIVYIFNLTTTILQPIASSLLRIAAEQHRWCL